MENADNIKSTPSTADSRRVKHEAAFGSHALTNDTRRKYDEVMKNTIKERERIVKRDSTVKTRPKSAYSSSKSVKASAPFPIANIVLFSLSITPL